MRIRGHIYTLIILVTFLVAYVSKTNLPNQQIVLELTHKGSSSAETDQAVEYIKQTLYDIGAEQISIKGQKNGQLKITYFSTEDVNDIQRQILGELNDGIDVIGDLPNSKQPAPDQSRDYILQISELQPEAHSSWDFEGTEIVNSNFKADRFTTVNTKAFNKFLCKHTTTSALLVSLSNNNNCDVYLQIRCCKTQEVRAGPEV